MSDFVISGFEVRGLHGETTIRVPISDNQLVIVGANGLGKTTFLNLFYYFISRQWYKLREYDFESLAVNVNGRALTVTSVELNALRVGGGKQPSLGLGNTSRAVNAVFDRAVYDEAFRAMLIKDLTTELYQSSSPRFAGVRFSSNEASALRNLLVHGSGASDFSDNLRDISAFLETCLTPQILYLPTYRRIERELNIVLPGLEDELRQFRELRRRSQSDSEPSFLELVEFGMEDVTRSIQRTLANQKETARAELNSLAGRYLRDVLRGEGDHFDRERISELSNDDVEDILNRVEERTLNEDDKASLRNVIGTIRDEGEIDTTSGYVAHFFIQLLSARQKLRKNEAVITRFVEVCNEYLDGKSFTYDDINYVLEVIKNKKTITLATLSSGEKQIVSLFSQVYLGTPKSYIIIIDEPELSLSVNWQKRLLPDLLASDRCSFVAAVTHSPFIFDNSLDKYAVDLGEHVTASVNELS